LSFESLGLFGIFLISFLAATILPVSSELAVIAAVQKFDPTLILIFASLGNILGSCLNFYIGHIGKLDWAHKYLKVSYEQIHKWQKRISKYGNLLAFLCWLPVVGDIIAIALGYFRMSFKGFLVYMSLGKVLRYAVIIYTIN
jgi:membrane protein YqaA with SNARE-associated domain